MKYAISNEYGQWWTGMTFGAKQARQEYESVGVLPLQLRDTDEYGELAVWNRQDYNLYEDNLCVEYHHHEETAKVRLAR